MSVRQRPLQEHTANTSKPLPKGPVAGARLTLPMPPGENHYKRHYCSVVPKHTVMAYPTAEAKKFTVAAHRAIEEGRLAGRIPVEPMEGPLVATLVVYSRDKRGDLQNFFKMLFDTMQNYEEKLRGTKEKLAMPGVYANDSQVVQIHAYREVDRENPRVEIYVVKEADYGA